MMSYSVEARKRGNERANGIHMRDRPGRRVNSSNPFVQGTNTTALLCLVGSGPMDLQQLFGHRRLVGTIEVSCGIGVHVSQHSLFM